MVDSSAHSAPFVDLLNALRTGDDEGFERNLDLLRSPAFSNGNPGNVTSDPLQVQSLSTSSSSQQDYPKDLSMELKDSQHENQFSQSNQVVESYLSNLASHFHDPKQFEVVKTLFLCPVLAAIPRASDGFYPLHIAACIGDELLGRFVAMAFPPAVIAQNSKGKTPLHFASREGNIEMVEFLTEMNPDSAKIASCKMKLPLHFAAAEGFDDVCDVLIAAYPEGVTKKTCKGKLPLHFASRKGSTETMELLLSAFPEGSKLLDWEDSPPLHIALREGREDAAMRLIEQCPDVLKVRNISGELPLDIAVGISSIVLLSAMINLWPGACKHVLRNVHQENDFARWSWAQIELLLLGASGMIQGRVTGEIDGENHLSSIECSGHTHPDYDSMGESSISDNDSSYPLTLLPNKSRCLCGMIDSLAPNQDQPMSLPLHAALYFANNTAFIKCVMDKCPDLIERPDLHGRYPLHIAAARSDLSMTSIGLELLEKFPQATEMRDVNGMLPLHIAICKKNDASFTQEILRANPQAAVKRCKVNDVYFMKKRPLYLAAGHGCELDIIYMLIRSDPNLAMYTKSRGSRSALVSF